MKNSCQIKVFSFQWIIIILVVAGLGCGALYSTQLFDGINTFKSFYFIMIVCLMLFFLSVRALWKKSVIKFSLSIPDVLMALYALWAVVRLLTSDTDSIHNLFFWEFSACVLWYFCLRFFFGISSENDWKKHIYFSLIVFGYVQLVFCALQLFGIVPSFSRILLVSGTFDNISKLCIYLTCILPVAVQEGLKANDTTSKGKIVQAVCLIYVLSWLVLVFTMGSRTALLSGFIGMGFYAGAQTGFFRRLKGITRKILVLTGLLLVVFGLVFLLVQYKKDSANGRLLIWKAALSGIKEAPLQGKGFNAFQAKYGHYQAAYFQKHSYNPKEIMLADNMNTALNDYLEIVFNLGFIGLLLIFAFYLSLFKGIAGKACNDADNVVAVAVLVIFFVSGVFYFVEKMLYVKVMTLYFAAYSVGYCKKIISFHFRSTAQKSIASIILIFCFFAGYATVNKAQHYTKWKKANALDQFGYFEEARTEYEHIYPHLQFTGQYLYMFAKNLYENETYRQCLASMEVAKPKVSNSDFYVLLGDVYFKTGDYENAAISYGYAAKMVPNRFRPLYKLFKMYEELGETQRASEIAQKIITKPVKVDSYEIQQIIKECIDFIQSNNYIP